jgi:cysteine desulfurase family protein
MVYLDHAATSYPKPAEVTRAVLDYLVTAGANPGRSGHTLSARAARIIFEAREAIARHLGADDSRQMIFTNNATTALNLALAGMLHSGGHVVTTSLEHNSVMRPLRHLRERRGVTVSVVRSDSDGRIDPEKIRAAITPRTRLVVVNHGSNVIGTVAPIPEIRQAVGAIPLLIDAAQTAGAVPINVARDAIDLLAFTGHKALLGPQGTGGLYIRPGLDLPPLTRGGTGSGSESDDQPAILPDLHESGTPNGPGIAGLGAGVRLLTVTGHDAVWRREQALLKRLWTGLREIGGLTLYGPDNQLGRLPVVSLRIGDQAPSATAHALDRRNDIKVRAGLHCAPEAHRSLGTFPAGTVRLAAGYMSTDADIDRAVAAIREIAQEARN